MNPRRLYRSRRDRVLAGVAGGMAEYLDLDPTVVRLLWILSIFFGGFGILVYIILAFVMPLDPEGAAAAGARSPAGPPPAGPWWGAPAAQPAWGAGTAAATASAPAGPASGTAAESDATVAATAGADEAAAATDATPAPTWGTAPGDPATPAWGAAPAGWAPPQPASPEAERRPGRGGVILGVGLIVFGVIAAAGVAIPGLLGSGLLWAGLVVALGVALVVGALRRPEPTA